MEIVIHKVENRDQLEELRNGSALTIEGMTVDEENLSAFLTWIVSCGTLVKNEVYVTSGKLMNDSYGLTGNNAYPDDLNIVSVKLSDMVDSSKVTIPRFQIGARWMDDIIDNNLNRESGEF